GWERSVPRCGSGPRRYDISSSWWLQRPAPAQPTLMPAQKPNDPQPRHARRVGRAAILRVPAPALAVSVSSANGEALERIPNTLGGEAGRRPGKARPSAVAPQLLPAPRMPACLPVYRLHLLAALQLRLSPRLASPRLASPSPHTPRARVSERVA